MKTNIPKKSHYDLIVVGGGPAGTTLSTLVKKYNPGRRILLLEKTKFPRHHVGESLLPEVVPVLKEMGVLEKISSAGFLRKLGATFVWGKNRTPWNADFDVISKLLAKGAVMSDYANTAWQVQRSRYDHILLEHARECGVEVNEGWRAVKTHEEGAKITGLTTIDPAGKSHNFSCDFLADCSGQNAFLSGVRRVRRYNEKLRNIAGYAYFSGAKWKISYTGHPDKTQIFICSVPNGWFWYIPISADLTSVGLVMNRDYFAKSGIKDFQTYYRKALKNCREIWPLLKSARWVDNVENTGKNFFTVSDWSYLSESSAGEGWIAAGDSAVFIDPILSSGVTLAHLSGHRAAYTLTSYWNEKKSETRHRMLMDYSQYYREASSSFLLLALYWYGNDPCAEKWWAEARKSVAMPLIDDKAAFIMIATGLSTAYDKMETVRSLLLDGIPNPSPFLEHVIGKSLPTELGPIAGTSVPRMTVRHAIEDSFLPMPNTGALKPLKKITFLKETGSDSVRQALNPRKYLLAPQLAIIKAITGRASIDQILTSVADELKLSKATAAHLTTKLIKELSLYDVLSFGPET